MATPHRAPVGELIAQAVMPIKTFILLGIGAATCIVLGVALVVFCFSGEEPAPPLPPTAEEKAVDDEPPPAEPKVLGLLEPKKDEPAPAPKKEEVVQVGNTEPVSVKPPKEEIPEPLPPAIFQEGEKRFIAGPLVLTPKTKYRVLRSALKTDATRPLRLAVTPAEYDDMGRLLAQLGSGYQFAKIGNEELSDSVRLSGFDVVFLTCASRAQVDPAAAPAIRRYVEQGGTLYASDLRYDLLRSAFPGYASAAPTATGIQQKVIGKVTDKALRQLLAPYIPLHFDTEGWKPAAFDKARVKVLMEGPYRTTKAETVTAPLLVQFRHQKGTVIFTSFHNAAQNSEMEQKLLEHLVFTAVTAQVEGFTARGMAATGFTPRENKSLTFAKATDNIRATFEHHKSASLQFALGFENQGAKLRLELTSPTGEKIEHEDAGSFIIEVQDAMPGRWQYTISTRELPFPNFPSTLLIGDATK